MFRFISIFVLLLYAGLFLLFFDKVLCIILVLNMKISQIKDFDSKSLAFICKKNYLLGFLEIILKQPIKKESFVFSFYS
ncbi:hypothetical protein BKH41_06795 [Helicobacter sp. 12S02232-10]|nr:hypothetical protein BKH41_06795 [Helicobacter sp. 12S02232-10]